MIIDTDLAFIHARFINVHPLAQGNLSQLRYECGTFDFIAIDTLKSLRSDLTATNPDVQFSFRQSVEPVYRQFIGLLLEPSVTSSQHDFEQARKTVESLQLAELGNFFRTSCLNAEEQQIDQIARKAVVLYPKLAGLSQNPTSESGDGI